MGDWAYEQRKLELMHPCELDARDDSHWTMEKELAQRKREEEARKKKEAPISDTQKITQIKAEIAKIKTSSDSVDAMLNILKNIVVIVNGE